MDFTFDAEQQELRAIAGDFLGAHSGSEQVRSAMASELGYDPQVWKQLGSELGWTAVHTPEACGGLGLGHVELTALVEIMGEHLLASPFFASVCLAANALLAVASEEQQAARLPGIAGGETRATLAWTEAAGTWDAAGIAATARPDGGGFVLDGVKRYVVDGHCADLLLVAARLPGTAGAAGLCLFAVEADTPGLTRRRLTTLDQTRRQAEIVLDGVRVGADAVLGAAGEAGPALERARDLAAVALAAEQVGGAQRCLDMAVAYAKERVQFGRPIGSFQAIKHKCADMMVDLESARSAAYYAACVADEGGGELASAAATAKAACSDAYFRCAADCIQIHGGVGFTWEYDVHLHFKRAKAGETLLGEPAFHRERIAQMIGL